MRRTYRSRRRRRRKSEHRGRGFSASEKAVAEDLAGQGRNVVLREANAASGNVRLVVAVPDLAMREPPSPNQQSRIVLGHTQVASVGCLLLANGERAPGDASSGEAACGGGSDVGRLSGRLGSR
jgi:hypothetical protein